MSKEWIQKEQKWKETFKQTKLYYKLVGFLLKGELHTATYNSHLLQNG